MIELKKLVLKNFMSHIDTNLDLSNLQGLVLVEGKTEDGRYESNGSGKSTLLEGIVYALSGYTLRNVSVNDVVNRKVGKDTDVELVLSTPDNIDIHRYRSHHDYGDALRILKDGEDISSRLNRDTQSKLNQIINIPYNVLVNTILLGEGLSSKFTQLSDSDKKSMIESTLNLGYDLNKCRDIANTKVKENNVKIANLKGRLSVLEPLIESSHDGVSLDDMKKHRKELDSDVEELSLKSSNRAMYKTTIESKLNVIQTTINSIMAINNRLGQLSNDMNSTMIKIDSYKNHEVTKCEMCKQSLESQESIQSVIDSYTSVYNNLLEDAKKATEELNKYPPLDTLTSKANELKAELNSVISEISTMTTDMAIKNRELSKLDSDIKHREDMDTNASSYATEVANSKKDISTLKQEVEDYTYLSKLFSPQGLITYILEESLGFINDRLRVYTNLLLDKDYQLSLDSGKLLLKDSSGASYQSLSNGEKRRLDISIQFSLHDYVHMYCRVKMDTIFIDEILDTLDSTGVSNIIEVLRLKLEYCDLKRILVITHNQELKSYFDNVITVYKDLDGNSKLL